MRKIYLLLAAAAILCLCFCSCSGRDAQDSASGNTSSVTASLAGGDTWEASSPSGSNSSADSAAPATSSVPFRDQVTVSVFVEGNKVSSSSAQASTGQQTSPNSQSQLSSGETHSGANVSSGEWIEADF